MSQIDSVLVQSIISFWFSDHKDKHYLKSEEFDGLIRDTFGEAMTEIRKGNLDFWREEPKACLAGLVLLDQFSRKVFALPTPKYDPK